MNGIGDLVATLVADTNQWQAGLSSAKSGLASFAKSAAVSLAGVAASFATIDFANGALHAAEEDIRATRKLEAVFHATGFAAGVTTDEVNKLAGELQRLTGFEDDATVGAAALLATFKNIRGEDFTKALKIAQDLAVVWEVDLLTAARKLGKQLDDLPINEVGAKLAELTGRFGGTAAAAQTASQKISVAWGAIDERIGKDIEPIVSLFADKFSPAVHDTINEMDNLNLATKEFDESFRGIFEIAKQMATGGGLQIIRDLAIAMKGDGLGDELMKTVHPPIPPKEPDAAANGGEVLFAESPNIADQLQDDFDKQLRELDKQLALARGEITRGEAAAMDAIAEGFSENAAEELRQRIDALDQLRNPLPEESAPKPEDKKIPEDKGFAALQKGSAEAASAVLTAMRGGNDKALQAAEQNVEQNDGMIALLGDMRDSLKGGGVALYAGSLS